MVFWIIFSEVLSKALVASSFAVKSVSDEPNKIPQNTKDHESGEFMSWSADPVDSCETNGTKILCQIQ